MCLQCVTEAELIGEIFPGWFLMKAMNSNSKEWKKDQLGLLLKDDSSFVFDNIFMEDTLQNYSAEEIDKLNETDLIWKKYDKFIDAIEIVKKKMICRPEIGFKLISATQKVGYDLDKMIFEFWFVDYIAKFLKNKSC